MATTSNEMVTSIKNNETKIKAEARSLSQFSSAIIRLTGSFLNDFELKNFSKAARFSHTSCQNDMKKRKEASQVRKDLLPCIFVFTINKDNLNPIHQFFNLSNTDANKALIRTRFREGYDSQKFKEFICFREYRSISPIQAAARSGDTFTVIELLSRLLKKEHGDENRVLALEQLEEVHKRISNQDILLDAVTAIKEIEFGENDIVKVNAKLRLEEIQQSELFQKQMQEFINDMDELRRQITDKTKKMQKRETISGSHHTPDLKSETERKITAENTPIKYADDAEVLEPVLKLLKAYIYYYLQYPQLASQNNRDRIDQLWEYVGECHRRLPHYFKQEFFNNKPFSVAPLPTFEAPPSRSPCRYWNNALLDLDGLGICTTFGLYRGRCAWVAAHRAPGLGRARRLLALDMAVVAHLYKLRITGLGNIIELLRHPETANTLVSTVNRLSLD